MFPEIHVGTVIQQAAVELGKPTPTGPTFEQWEQWVYDALRAIRRRAKKGRCTPSHEDVEYVARQALVRHVQSWTPESNVQRYEFGVDDGRESRTYFKSSTTMKVDDDLLDEICALNRGAFTIRPHFRMDPKPRY